jgi:hypothetical protein
MEFARLTLRTGKFRCPSIILVEQGIGYKVSLSLSIFLPVPSQLHSEQHTIKDSSMTLELARWINVGVASTEKVAWEQVRAGTKLAVGWENVLAIIVEFPGKRVEVNYT